MRQDPSSPGMADFAAMVKIEYQNAETIIAAEHRIQTVGYDDIGVAGIERCRIGGVLGVNCAAVKLNPSFLERNSSAAKAFRSTLPVAHALTIIFLS